MLISTAAAQSTVPGSNVTDEPQQVPPYIEALSKKETPTISPRVAEIQAKSSDAIIYVDSDASPGGDGTSWSGAYAYLQDALDEANARQGIAEIWVAEGVYYPDLDQDGDHVLGSPDEQFEIFRDGVQLYGGFLGAESNRSARDPESNITVLSGDVGRDDVTNSNGVTVSPEDITGDNARVVWIEGADGSSITSITVVDGVTITAGHRDAGASYPVGGGAVCRAAVQGQSCSPRLNQLSFLGNSAESGGGFVIVALEGETTASPQITNSHFENNEAFRTCTSCLSSGGAVAIAANASSFGSDPAVTRPVFEATDFVNNTSSNNREYGSGGAVHIGASSSNTDTSPVFKNVEFRGNESGSTGGYRGGGAVMNSVRGSSSPRFENVIFEGNEALQFGGAYNAEVYWGAGWIGEGHSAQFEDVIFRNNESGFGAALSISTVRDGARDQSQFINSVFEDNINWGIVLNSQGGSISTRFANSVVVGSRDVLYPSSDRDHLIVLNSDPGKNGTVTPFFTNTTIYAPTLDESIFLFSGPEAGGEMVMPTFQNSILWGESMPSSPVFEREGNVFVGFSHTVLQGGIVDEPWMIDLGANLSVNPLFVDADGPDGVVGTPDDDFRLMEESPAIDHGDGTVLPADHTDLDEDGNTTEIIPLDLAGQDRERGQGVDLGPFESGSSGGGEYELALRLRGHPRSNEAGAAPADHLALEFEIENQGSISVDAVCIGGQVDGQELNISIPNGDADEDGCIDAIRSQGSEMITVQSSSPTGSVESVPLSVRINEIEGEPADISFQDEVSIYLARGENGKLFDYSSNSYSFRNPQALTAAEAFDELLVSSISPEYSVLLFIQYIATQNGRCFGMAASAARYFEDSSTKPLSGDPNDWDEQDSVVLERITDYHVSQLAHIPATRGRPNAERYDQAEEFKRLRGALREGDATILGIHDPDYESDHAVLATKLTSLASDERAFIELYDSNHPLTSRIATFRTDVDSVLYESSAYEYTYMMQIGVPRYIYPDPKTTFAENFVQAIQSESLDTYSFLHIPDGLLSAGRTAAKVKSMTQEQPVSIASLGQFETEFIVEAPDEMESGIRADGTLVSEIVGSSVDTLLMKDGSEIVTVSVPEGLDYNVSGTPSGTGTSYFSRVVGATEQSYWTPSISTLPSSVVSYSDSAPDAVIVDVDGDGTVDEEVTAGNQTLPVTLVSFSGVYKNEAVTLKWETEGEVNNDGFYVQRRGSSDWEQVGFVESKQSKSGAQYRFVDETIGFEENILEYRLRQVDRDGTETLLDPIRIDRSRPNKFRLHKPFPNPVRGRLTLRYQLPEQAHVRAQAYDVMGRLVVTWIDESRPAGRVEQQVSTQSLASGLYFIRLTAGDKEAIRRITVVR